jgi:hypothetical protein
VSKVSGRDASSLRQAWRILSLLGILSQSAFLATKFQRRKASQDASPGWRVRAVRPARTLARNTTRAPMSVTIEDCCMGYSAPFLCNLDEVQPSAGSAIALAFFVSH